MITLSGLLLFILGYNYLQNFLIANNIFFYFVFFIVIVLYFAVDFVKIKKFFFLYKLWLVAFLIILLVGTSWTAAIYSRYNSETVGNNLIPFHDGIAQTEEAIKGFLAGQNPYHRDYSGTELDKNFSQIRLMDGTLISNPALTHYVYLPFYFLFSLPFYLLGQLFFGWFDQRFIIGLSFLVIILCGLCLLRHRNKKLIFLIIFCFNPLMANLFIIGYNDYFVLSLLLLTILLLKNKKICFSAITLALACLSKQSAWFFVPFYFLYLFYHQQGKNYFKLKIILQKIWPAIIIFLIILIPFLINNWSSFIDDIILYPAGKTINAYPIKGFGFGYLIYKMGIVENVFAYFPFWIWQLIFGLPLFLFLIYHQKFHNTLSTMLLNYGIFLLVFWFFSRFFHQNYIGYLSDIFLLSFLLREHIHKPQIKVVE